MQLTHPSALFALLLSAAVEPAAAAASRPDGEKCAACYKLAEHVASQMDATEPRAEENISIGVRLGPNGESLPNRVIKYGDSERRLLEVLENACDANPFKPQCKNLLFEAEALISHWFHEARNDPFAKYVCDARINGCNAQVAAAFSARQDKDVEVEDDSKRAPKKPETLKKEERKAEKKATPPPTAQKEESHKSSHSAHAHSFDPKAFAMAIVNRFKGNMQRIYRLSGELCKEVRPLISGRKWEQLGKMAKDPEFYRKYWIVFAAFIFIIYFVFSLLEPLFASKAPKTRSASGSKRKTAAKVKKDN